MRYVQLKIDKLLRLNTACLKNLLTFIPMANLTTRHFHLRSVYTPKSLEPYSWLKLNA